MAFAAFSVITFPILETYSNGTGINESTSTRYGRFSIANLGYSSVQCSSIPVAMGKMALTCPYGNITNLVENGVGINSVDSPVRDACLVDFGLESGNAKCSSNMDHTKVVDTFNSECVG